MADTEDIKVTELYRIINRAIKKYGESTDSDVSLTSEINIFKQKYAYYAQQHLQLIIFEEPVSSLQQIENAERFCKELEYLKKETDLYNEKGSVSEDGCRYLFQQLSEYESHIEDDNSKHVESLKALLKHYLPEYKKEIVINEYNLDMDIMKRIQNSNKKRKIKAKNDSFLQKRAQLFFESFMKDGYLQNMEACPEKIDLYEKSLKFVNLLPSNKYSRVKKFKIKVEINEKIKKMAEALGPGYAGKAQKATAEIRKFQNSIVKTINYVNGKKTLYMSVDAYNEKLYEEDRCR